MNYGIHETDPFGFLTPPRAYPKSASRREDIDSSEEDENTHDSSDSLPSGWYFT